MQYDPKFHPFLLLLLENILNFLYDHIAKSGDLQARVHWTPNTIVLWDNRVTAHVCTILIACRHRKLTIFLSECYC